MKSKNRVAIVFIVIILLIVFLYSFFNMGNNEKTDSRAEKADISSIKHPELDLDMTIFRIELENEYYLKKAVNHYLMSFFKNLNLNNFNMDVMNKDYVNFMEITREDVLLPYLNIDVIDYDILHYKKIKDKFIVDLIYRDKKTEKKNNKSFSVSEKGLCDRPFVSIKNIDKAVDNSDFKINIVEKGVFDGYEIYKINIENISEELLLIDDSMYGFNAIKGSNKYYHHLENRGKFYDIVPGEVGKFLVKFNCLDPEEIYVTINEKEFKIY